MSFLTTIKAFSTKLNNAAKAMDEQVDNYVDKALEVIQKYDTSNEDDIESIKKELKDLFSIFEIQPKKKAINGYIHYTTSTRAECSKLNPDKTPTQITKLLSEKWNSFKDEEKKEWNTKAKSVQPQTEEQKKAKRSKKAPLEDKKEKIICNYQGCDKIIKNPKKHTDGCIYCATHFKKVVSDEKKAENTPKVKPSSKSPFVSPSVSPTDINKFNFKKEAPVHISENPKWWVCKGIKLDGETKNRYHVATGLVLDINEPKLIGTFINNKAVLLDSVSEDIKEWCRKSGIDVEDEIEDEIEDFEDEEDEE